MITKTNAVLKLVEENKNGQTFAKMALLAGKNKEGKTRYLNGSFYVGDNIVNNPSFVSVRDSLLTSETILVSVSIKYLFGKANSEKPQYINYEGVVSDICLK